MLLIMRKSCEVFVKILSSLAANAANPHFLHTYQLTEWARSHDGHLDTVRRLTAPPKTMEKMTIIFPYFPFFADFQNFHKWKISSKKKRYAEVTRINSGNRLHHAELDASKCRGKDCQRSQLHFPNE